MWKIFDPEEYNLLASSVACTRVEPQAQYPSDVLVSDTIGNFLTVTVHDAFLNLPKDKTCSFGIFPTRGGAMAELNFTFQSSTIQQSSAI
jgi:hypothetical protein